MDLAEQASLITANCQRLQVGARVIFPYDDWEFVQPFCRGIMITVIYIYNILIVIVIVIDIIRIITVIVLLLTFRIANIDII